MSLAETRQELIESLQGNLSVLLRPLPIVNAGLDLEESALWFEALGICNLLLYADPDRFAENLVKSGFTRRYYLRKSRDEGNVDDHQLAISRWDSFLDVVAVGHFGLAREIVALSSRAWTPAGEYEDDFCYRAFLHTFIMAPSESRDSGLTRALARWEAWLSGTPSIRLELCRALLSGDELSFATGFDALIVEQQALVARQQKMLVAADIAFLPRSQLFVEGLALLKLAERLGFALRVDYPLCPAIARLPVRIDKIDDLFPELEAARAIQADDE